MRPALDQKEYITASGKSINVEFFGELEYLPTQKLMADFAANREPDEPDKIWLLQHPQVYTQGTACQQNTLLPSAIPVVKSDRGGQITFHGPGQIVMYPMLKLKDYGLGIKALVSALEQTVINLLDEQGVGSDRREDAPGVYVNAAKIAALGLRIRRGTSYHGLSLNVDMDISPFANIDPCGYQGLQVTQLSQHIDAPDINEISDRLVKLFLAQL